MTVEHKWYALRVRPRYEKQVAQSIESKGIKSFLPLYSSRRHWSDRTKEVELPLFDGYVFCQTDANDRLAVLVTPGVMHLVGIGKTPVPIEEREMDAIRSVVSAGSVVRPWPFLREGERVRIDNGPLRNVEGILTRIDNSDQVVISVTLLQRSIAVEIDRASLTPMRSWMRQPLGSHPNS